MLLSGRANSGFHETPLRLLTGTSRLTASQHQVVSYEVLTEQRELRLALAAQDCESTLAQAIPRCAASATACGFSAARRGCRDSQHGPGRRGCSRDSAELLDRIDRADALDLDRDPAASSSRHIRSTGPTSVGHSRLTSRSPVRRPRIVGQQELQVTLDTVLLEPAASPISWATSESTSSSRISSRSSLRPARLRTMSVSPSSSITVGGVIQLRGLNPPASACTRTEPSSFNISRRRIPGGGRSVCRCSRPRSEQRSGASRHPTVRFGQYRATRRCQTPLQPRFSRAVGTSASCYSTACSRRRRVDQHRARPSARQGVDLGR